MSWHRIILGRNQEPPRHVATMPFVDSRYLAGAIYNLEHLRTEPVCNYTRRTILLAVSSYAIPKGCHQLSRGGHHSYKSDYRADQTLPRHLLPPAAACCRLGQYCCNGMQPALQATAIHIAKVHLNTPVVQHLKISRNAPTFIIIGCVFQPHVSNQAPQCTHVVHIIRPLTNPAAHSQPPWRPVPRTQLKIR